MENACRTCLRKCWNSEARDMKNIFENTLTANEDNKAFGIREKLEQCSGIEIKPHECWPKRICQRCVQAMEAAYDFRLMCRVNEVKLGELIAMTDFKTGALEKPNISPVEHLILAEENSDLDADNASADVEHEVNTVLRSTRKSHKQHVQVKRVLSRKRTKKTTQRLQSKKTKLERQDANKLCQLEDDDVVHSCNANSDATNSRIICEICGNMYKRQSVLTLHMRRHLQLKPFECEICSKAFVSKPQLHRHMRVHTGDRPFTCKICDRTFSDLSTVRKHERIHTNERPYVCQSCGKSFAYSHVLKDHMLTHTGEKRFRCKPCNKTFARKHLLKQHFGTLTHQQVAENHSNESKEV